MSINHIFDNNKEWINKKLSIDKDYFKKLAQDQTPEILYIGCSDSRVSAGDLMEVEPGTVFVHRNIANLVPNTDMNSKSVIDYAVTHLDIKHIVVCGHYKCGGIKAAMEKENLGVLNPWLGNIRDVYRLHFDELEALTDLEQRYDRLVELNVAEQCINVLKIPTVQEAIIKKKLQMHGWVFDIKTGQLIDLTLDIMNEFSNSHSKVSSIYRIK
ncbi:carbonic anhydrase [Sphingobacterium rhinopitheci]|uniref:carbonic anhydrase n=1 Tax=Sphingobacterium rhinopitheci TaxID=2781960 RepID=UPI001F51A9E3|nr:carbonic anhydrase [Sphingobacterium rhinopitheci]MCI0922619.1 carbonic anhydrase [Sphingobacterium rhinopitheci]